MKRFTAINFQPLLSAILLAMSVFLINGPAIFAHGGEDHGDAKPKVATTAKGMVLSTARLGDFEITLKHPALEPDTAARGLLFITRFETNEAVDEAAPTMEIQSASGAVTQVAVEKSGNPGSFDLKIPALPNGSYILRASMKTGDGTRTATFSGVEVTHPEAETAAGGASWLSTILLFTIGSVVVALFGILFYFVWRMADEKQVPVETVSA